MSILRKVVLGAIVKEAVEKAGGVDNIVANAKDLGSHVMSRAGEVKTAFNERNMEKGAVVAGEIANDGVTAVTETAEATVEFAADLLTTGVAKMDSVTDNIEHYIVEKCEASVERTKQRKNKSNTP